MAKKKNTGTDPHAAAVALGRLGGSKRTDKPKGLAKISPERRAEIRAKALETRRANKARNTHK